jgi:putative nucleotidyltransferase with HDIG domain
LTAEPDLAGPALSGRRAVLLADPRPERLGQVAEALGREFRVDLVRDGGAAFEALACGRCFAAVVAMALPGLSGLEVLRRLSALKLERRPSVLAAGAAGDVRLEVVRTHGLADGVQPLPCADGVLLRRVWQLADRELEQRWSRLAPLQKVVVGSTRSLLDEAGGVVRQGGELGAESARHAGQQVVEVLRARLMGDILTSLRAYHDYTFAHSFRVATHLATFALAIGMRRGDAELLAQAGLLHDIGKTAVPVRILDKPGPLDGSERGVVQQHPLVAAEVLRRTPALPAHLIHVAERHHERLDGTGYPHGLAGGRIDEPSLLCAIADVHTALTDRRAYRNPLSDADAFAHMRGFVGRHFEPALFRRYEQLMLDGPVPALPGDPATGVTPA